MYNCNRKALTTSLLGIRTSVRHVSGGYPPLILLQYECSYLCIVVDRKRRELFVELFVRSVWRVRWKSGSTTDGVQRCLSKTVSVVTRTPWGTHYVEFLRRAENRNYRRVLHRSTVWNTVRWRLKVWSQQIWSGHSTVYGSTIRKTTWTRTGTNENGRRATLRNTYVHSHRASSFWSGTDVRAHTVRVSTVYGKRIKRKIIMIEQREGASIGTKHADYALMGAYVYNRP